MLATPTPAAVTSPSAETRATELLLVDQVIRPRPARGRSAGPRRVASRRTLSPTRRVSSCGATATADTDVRSALEQAREHVIARHKRPRRQRPGARYGILGNAVLDLFLGIGGCDDQHRGATQDRSALIGRRGQEFLSNPVRYLGACARELEARAFALLGHERMKSGRL